jgi:menaquinone-9 beta-reductase
VRNTRRFFSGTGAVGPLVTFHASDTCVDHPYAGGIALIGDAAAASDPSWGQGLGITLRDTRVLRNSLLADEDWDRAGQLMRSSTTATIARCIHAKTG